MPATTQSVFEHHLASFDAGDMDAILSDYAPDAVLLTPEGVYRGPAQIRPVLQGLLDRVFSNCTQFKMLRQVIEGEVAYIVWTAEAKRCRVPLATDTFVIRGGKIVVQTFAARVEER